MRTIPATLQTTYANLLQTHLNRPFFEFEGAPFMRKLGNKTYWYANHRTAAGAPLKQRYLGPDTDEMRTRIEEMRAQRQSQADFRDYASSLVAQLRAGDIAGPDRKTGPMLRALTNSGVFRLGGTLVGTHAFRHYDLVLGAYLSDATTWITQTDDIDIAGFEKLSMAIEDTADPSLVDALTHLGFKPKPTMDRGKSTSWVLPDASYSIDFLTPAFAKEGPRKLPALSLWAQSLRFLHYLIADPIDAVSPYMEGLLVKIPRPERYAVHKLIIAQRRKGITAKARKDIEQARSIIWAMADFQPYELKVAIIDADSHGPKWRESLDRALDLKIIPDKPTRPGDSAEFFGTALNASIRLRISSTALQLLYGDDSLETAETHRAQIEKMLRAKFRREPSADVLLRAEDVETFRKTKP